MIFDDLQLRALAMTGGGGIEQIADRRNRVPMLADDFSDIGLAHPQPEDNFPRLFQTSDDHLVRIINQLPNDELEEFLH